MSQNTLLLLVPDWPQAQVRLVNAEGGFRLRELDVGFPEFLVVPVTNVGAEQIATGAPRASPVGLSYLVARRVAASCTRVAITVSSLQLRVLGMIALASGVTGLTCYPRRNTSPAGPW